MKAERLLHERHQLSDQAFVELRIWRVPQRVTGSAHDLKYALAYVELPGAELLTVKLDGAPDLALRAAIHLRLPEEGIHLFDTAGHALR